MTRHGNLSLALLSVGLASLLVGSAPVAAEKRAGTAHLYGAVGETGRVHETVSIVKRRTGRYRVFKFAFKAIPMTCENGASTTYGLHETQATPLRSPPRFGWGAGGAVVMLSTEDGPEPSYSWELEVRVRGSKAAAGMLRITGSALEVDGSPPQKCRSGPLNWTTAPRD